MRIVPIGNWARQGSDRNGYDGRGGNGGRAEVRLGAFTCVHVRLGVGVGAVGGGGRRGWGVRVRVRGWGQCIVYSV